MTKKQWRRLDAFNGPITGVPRAVAASRLGVSRQRVHQLVQNGRLSEVVICGCRLVSFSSLTALLWNREWGEDGRG